MLMTGAEFSWPKLEMEKTEKSGLKLHLFSTKEQIIEVQTVKVDIFL